MAGALDFLSGGEPYSPQVIKMDPETNAMIDKSGQDAMISSKDLAKQSMQGTGDTNFLAGAQGVGNVAMSGALQNKYEKLAGDQMQELGARQGFLADQRRADRLQQSAHMAYARQQVANQNYARQIAAYNNQVAARASVLSSLLSLGGAAVGFYFGGPVGAMAGAQAGKSLGESAGGGGGGNANSAS